MNKYQIIPYEPEHMAAMVFDKEALSYSLGKPIHEMANLYKDRGPAVTAFADEVPILIAGVNILWPGTGEAWALLATQAVMHGVFIHRHAATFLADIAREHKLERIQATAEEDNHVNCAWLFALGFEYEGKMAKYWQGKTFLRFARIYEVE